MLNARKILIVCCLSIAVSAFAFAAEGTYVDNGADFIRVSKALEEDHVSDKFQLRISKKTTGLVCPSGQAEEVIVGNMPFSERDSVKISDGRFDLPILKKSQTVFLSCKEQDELVWHKYVLAPCSKDKKKCITGDFQMQSDSAIRETVINKDGRLYARVSVSDPNLFFCPEKKPVKVIGLTQRDSTMIQVRTVGKDSFALLFFSKTDRDVKGGIYYPLEYANLKFDVQCGEDPVKELWVKPFRIPGRMLEMK